ncbi:MAG: hypothetical protein OXD46_11765 [Chloroflexi bacterium]|nr:hypothetical protein [Chloroflexota bacterium]
MDNSQQSEYLKEVTAGVRKDLNKGFARSAVAERLAELGFSATDPVQFVQEVDNERRRRNRVMGSVWIYVGLAVAVTAFSQNCIVSFAGEQRNALVWIVFILGVAVVVHAIKSVKRNAEVTEEEG